MLRTLRLQGSIVNRRGVHMKSLIVRTSGKMELTEKKLGVLESGKIRIRMKYAGVGFADMMAVRGVYILAPRKPFCPGYEFAGLIESIGSVVTGRRVGERVAGMLPSMDCYQEYIDIDPSWAVAVPEGLSMDSAALIPLNYLTALSMIDRFARLSVGQSFVIHGAAGGVGSAALELARHRGLAAFGTGSRAKLADISALGSTAIEMTDSWLAEARRVCPGGFDAAFDSFGGKCMRDSWASLAKNGTLVSYGFVPGVDAGNAHLVRGLLFHAGKKLRSQGKKTAICGTPSIVKRNPLWYRQALAETFALADKGTLKPKLFDVIPWEKAQEAHQAIIERKVRGKMLLGFS